MNRRTAIRQFAFISAGVFLIPSCMQDKSKASMLVKNFRLEAGDENLLDELCETIIPATETPGSRDVGAHLYVLKMIDDCAGKEDQERFVSGLDEFSQFAKKQAGVHFTEANLQQRNSVLSELEKREADGKDNMLYFYKTVKRLTIQGYSTSEFFLTKVHVYELVPGRYHGCVPVSAKETKLAS